MDKMFRSFLFSEAYLWLFRFIFQPRRFQHEYEQLSFWQRVESMLWLVFPLLLFSCIVGYAGRYLFWLWMPSFYNPCASGIITPTTSCFILDTIRGTLWGGIAGMSAGSLFGVSFGAAFSLAGGIAGGLVVDTKTDIASGALVGLVFALAFGIILGILLGLTTKRQRQRRRLYLLRTIISSMIGVAFGGIGGITIGFVAGMILGEIDGERLTQHGTTGSLGSLIGGITSGLIMSALCRVIEDVMRSRRAPVRFWQLFQVMQRSTIAFAGIVGSTAGTIGILAVARHLPITGLQVNIKISLEVCTLAGMVFCLSYLLGYYRLPLYPFTSSAMLFIYLLYRFCAQSMALRLKQSPLYWDELAFLPYPLLKTCLNILYHENRDVFLKQCRFIVSERPQQGISAILVLQEVALRELLFLRTMAEIVQAGPLLTQLFPPEIRYFNDDDAWFKPFFTLEKISHNAMVYLKFQSPQAKREILSEINADLTTLGRFDLEGSRHIRFLFARILRSWRQTLQACQITKKELENPYRPGQILPPDDKTFVGRFDLAHSISSAIQKKHCTAFFLEGERRIGKSSILLRLPGMLGSDYLRVLLSLENTAMLASSATFFYHLARGLYYELAPHCPDLKKLPFEELDEAKHVNEHMVYFVFGEWLSLIEQFLEQKKYILLLCFDEFENINNAQFDRSLLFGWFRELIQFHHHFILFFCGRRPRVSTVNWSSYFVNVETQHVSVLRPEEVHELVTRPISYTVFDSASIEAIIHLSGCHPFLVQALCSKLITTLNDTNRQQANLADVEVAAQDVVEAYVDYFIEQWERCDRRQQQCLLWLSQQQRLSLTVLAERLACPKPEVGELLHALQLRELVSYQEEICTISIPLFQRWLQTNNLVQY